MPSCRGRTACFFVVVVLFITALRHFQGHFGRGQLTLPYGSCCSWAGLLGSLQVPILSSHYFVSNWQLLFLNHRKGETGRRNYFMTNLHEIMLPDVRIEPATVRILGGAWRDRMHNSNQTIPVQVQSTLCCQLPNICSLRIIKCFCHTYHISRAKTILWK